MKSIPTEQIEHSIRVLRGYRGMLNTPPEPKQKHPIGFVTPKEK